MYGSWLIVPFYLINGFSANAIYIKPVLSDDGVHCRVVVSPHYNHVTDARCLRTGHDGVAGCIMLRKIIAMRLKIVVNILQRLFTE